MKSIVISIVVKSLYALLFIFTTELSFAQNSDKHGAEQGYEQPTVEQSSVVQDVIEQIATELVTAELVATEQTIVEQSAPKQAVSEQVAVEVPAVEQATAEQVTEESPLAKNYYLKSAIIHFETKEYGKAIDALELAILLEPENKEVLTLLEKSRKLAGIQSDSIGLRDKSGVVKSTSSKSPEVNRDSSSIEKAYTAMEEKRYDDAAEILDPILEIDPTNEEALYLRGKISDIRHERIRVSLETTYNQEKLKSLEHIKESSIPYQGILRFTTKEEWGNIEKRTIPESDMIIKENISKTEQLQIIPSPVKNQYSKVIEDALNTIISFEFIDTPLTDVVTFIREKTDVNMIFDPEADDRSVTLKLKEVTVRTALKYILPKEYEYVIEENIIHVYQQKMELRVYDVRDILINLDDKSPFFFDITAAATASMAVSGGGQGAEKSRTPFQRVSDVIEMIVKTVYPSTWTRNGGEGTIIARTDQPGDLVVSNSVYVHKQIEDLLASLRSSQNLQVSIEARIISVTDEFLEDLGSNITTFFEDDQTVDTGAENVGQDDSGNLLTAGAGIDLDYSIFTNLEGFLKAVQESKGSEILTSPRITLSNTQRGNIAVIRTENYVQSTSVSDGVVTPEIGTIPEGTTFDVRPIVSADRKYVYLEVTPSVFQIEEIQDFEFSNFDDFEGDLGGGGNGTTYIPPQQTIQLPKVNVSQVSVTVCVPDKGTLMIGGLGTVNNGKTETGVPVLSKIPIIKFLFTRNQTTNKKTNLIILLKPTIIIREEQEDSLRRSFAKYQALDIHKGN
ncbi:MAG: hypothetical protein MRJ65_06190 [Candidatus Brocadiaceae bacterium]|nr:hypothetical protein [Candidatus Brocadiaceae bacterium]